MKTPDFDLIIVGAGVSGIGSGVHFTEKCPDKSFAILEARDNIGGTWDLFRYPGIRSDSDMHTFGYKFKPWTNPKSIADGPSILEYLNEAIDEYGLRDKIQFGHKFIEASWSTEDALWTLKIKTSAGEKEISCNFLSMCSGYYSYDTPHNPQLPGEGDFSGQIVHPQLWTNDIDYKDKKVVVIGSGATAVTLIPSMAKETEHITMLQRSPTYIVSQPSKDWFANLARKLLPQKLAYKVSRAKNIWWQNIVYKTARNKPEKTKKQIFKMTRKSLGQDKNYDLDPHFVPAYNPWEQRLCVVPDNDLYESIKAGEASIITDHIDTLTPKGIKLRSGTHLDCDLIVKATGINVIVLAQGAFSVDGHPVDFSKTFTYEGMMFSDVPNMISTFGYVNASWTLRADLISEYMCRIVNHMEETGTVQATPRAPEGMEGKPWITTFNPGYINRVLDQMPMQGDREPWVNTQDYKRDKKVLPSKPIDDGFMEFSNPADVNTASVAAE